MDFVLSAKELWKLGVKEEDIFDLTQNNDKICCGAITKNDIIFAMLGEYFSWSFKDKEVLDYKMAEYLFNELNRSNRIYAEQEELYKLAEKEMIFRTTDNCEGDCDILKKTLKFRDFLERMSGKDD